MSFVPRSEVFDPNEVGLYHCYNKSVFGMLLLGKGNEWKENYCHRKEWFRTEFKKVARCMAIDILDYAVMDNHFHVLVRNRPDLRDLWSVEEVARRWYTFCPEEYDENGDPVDPTPWQIQLWTGDPKRVQELRHRLGDLSWLMAILQRRIARRANWEQGTTGSHFWAGRFKAKRIENEAGLLACSMYINRNPLSAGITRELGDPCFTSLFERIMADWESVRTELYGEDAPAVPLPWGAQGPSITANSPTAAAWLSELFLDERSVAYGAEEADRDNATQEVATLIASSPLESPESDNSAASIPVTPTEPTSSCAKRSAADQKSKSKSKRELKPLSPLRPRLSNKGYLPLTMHEYLRIMKWMISQQREEAPQQDDAPSGIFERIGCEAASWMEQVIEIAQRIERFVSHVHRAKSPAPT